MRIVTGSQPGAAADTRSVVLGLTGSESTTGEITVDAKDGWFLLTHTYFKKSAYDDLVIECEDNLGEIQVVQAGLRYSSTLLTPDWYIDFFTVCNYQSSVKKNYPCYHWIGKKVKHVTATSATGKYSFSSVVVSCAFARVDAHTAVKKKYAARITTTWYVFIRTLIGIGLLRLHTYMHYRHFSNFEELSYL